ncbi:SWIM zinc finger family protein [Amycolatopsis suaedae]|uniref:SWIM zinc finger family protein n=1 Tax=Amycolatopsis suaedae TaxID=2510978 RepID=UPI001F10725E|nr:SWIM zinc finger family protein [Amycolatopsis suaedae]
MVEAPVRWSTERVLELAPDAASVRAGRAQAAAVGWSGAGASPAAVWGACQGSGKKPYQTCVELAEPAFRCSCPSRKFPCKHALGLLLRWAAGELPEDTEPDWVRAWLHERAARAEKAEQRKAEAGPKDEAAAAQRAQRRAGRVGTGAAELREWLLDQVRAGLSGLDRTGSDELRRVAARMIDAQAPGLATGLRRASGLAGRGRDWPSRLLEELSLLYLLAGAQTRVDELPDALADTVRTRLGFPADTGRVLASGERVADDWLVCGVVDEERDQLITRRCWLRGTRTGRPALVLSFAPPGRPLDSSLPAGHRVTAELAFHPGALPLRALVAERGEPVPAACPRGDTVPAALAAHAEALAADPWLDRWPALLADLVPATEGDELLLSDVDGRALALTPAFDPWPLLAVSAGRPVTIGGEWTSAGLRPLLCWDGDRAVRL